MANGNGNGSIATVHAYAPIERVSYFYGQLLTERDLRAEQDYHVMLRRLMQREMLGTGTVAGLGIEQVGTDGTFIVHPGLALDRDGRELLLTTDVTIQAVPDVVADQTSHYLDGIVSASDIADALSTEWNASVGAGDVGFLWSILYAFNMANDIDPPAMGGGPPDPLPMLSALLARLGDPPGGFVLPLGEPLFIYLFHRLVGLTFLGLRYRERGSLPSPSVLGGACCDADGCQPARLQEGVDVIASEVYPDNPDFSLDERVIIERCLENDQNPDGVTSPVTPPPPPWQHDRDQCLAEAVIASWRGLPDVRSCAADLPVVTIGGVGFARLARLNSTDPRVLLTDQIRTRPLAAGAPALRALLESLTQVQTLVEIAPRVQAIDPPMQGPLVYSAVEARIKAFVTSRVKPDSGTPASWSVTFYPSTGTPPDPPQTWTSASPPPGTFNIAIALDFIEAAANSLDPSEVDIVITPTPMSGSLSLPAGTYVWIINLNDDPPTTPQKIVAQATEDILQGSPRFPAFLGLPVVPSGYGAPSGTDNQFTGVFYVP